MDRRHREQRPSRRSKNPDLIEKGGDAIDHKATRVSTPSGSTRRRKRSCKAAMTLHQGVKARIESSDSSDSPLWPDSCRSRPNF